MNRQYNKADVNSWLSRAKDDLKWASSSLKDGFYPQTCRESCLILNAYYMPTRYPDIPEVPGMRSKETANKAIKIAKEIIEFVETELEK